MKKISVVIIFLLVLIAAPAVGQVTDKLPLRFGIKLGFNLANVTNYPGSTDSRTAYVAGIMVMSKKSPLLSYQIELLLSGKGFERDDLADSANPVRLTTRLTYLEVPIMIRLKIPIPGKYRPFLIGGGFMAIRMKESVLIKQGLVERVFEDDKSQKSELGYIFGGGLEIKAGNSAIIIEARLEKSITNSLTDIDSQNNIFDSKNELLSIQFGYLW